jgi:PAS domain S-box-containing protein
MDIPEPRLDGFAFQHSPYLLGVVAPDGTLKVVNAAWGKALGYAVGEFVGHKLFKFVDDGDHAAVLKLANPRLAASGEPPLELALRCSDGSYKAFAWERRQIPGEERVLISGQDITEKKKIEVTDSLKMYELYEAARKLNAPAGGEKE